MSQARKKSFKGAGCKLGELKMKVASTVGRVVWASFRAVLDDANDEHS